MTTILAIETATEACSVAFANGGEVLERHEITPRQHSQRLLSMLDDLLPGGDLLQHGIEAIAYGCGPGSFTGLRIAASAVQGLAYATGLPAVPVSTLAAQTQTAYRLGHVKDGQVVFSTLDARINEVYCAWYRVEQGRIEALTAAQACAPGLVSVPPGCESAVGIGSGCLFLADMPAPAQALLQHCEPDLLPQAQDLIPLARTAIKRGETQRAAQVQPVYVRDEINWKKIPQQGKRT